MNLNELRARLTAAIARMQELRAIDTPTDENRSEMTDLLTSTTELRTQLEAAEAAERQFSELEAFANRPHEGRSLNGQPLNAGSITQPASGQVRQADQLWDEFGLDVMSRGLSQRQADFVMGDDYRGEFRNFLRGHQSRALNESILADGGAVVPLEMTREIIQRLQAPNRVYGAVRKIRTSADSITIPKFLGGSSTQMSGLATQWLGESGSAAEDTSLENWGQVKIEVHRGGFVVLCSRSLVEDAMFDIEAWVSAMIADVYTQTIESVILNGSGVGRPFGILTRAGSGAQQVDTFNVGNPIAAASLVNILGEVDEQYASNASWIMRRAAYYTQIADLQGTDSHFVFGTNTLTVGGTQPRVDTQLLGYPNLLSDHMPALGAGNNIIVLGDLMMLYALLERVALSIEPYIDPTIQKKDQKGWYVRFRLGGDVWQEEAGVIGVNS